MTAFNATTLAGGAGLLAAALMLAGGPAGAAARPNFDGVWVIQGGPLDMKPGAMLFAPGRRSELAAQEASGRPRLTQAKLKGVYLEKQAALRKAAAEGKPQSDSGALCLPQGMPAFWNGPYAFEILVGAHEVHFSQEWNDQTRRVYLDGRPHPTDADPSYNGHSTGRWEGDTLVVDTTNIREDTAVSGSTHSDAMHIVERIRLLDPERLEVRQTVEDAKAFEEPWIYTYVLRRKPEFELQEYVCAANNRNPVDENGVTRAAIAPPTPK